MKFLTILSAVVIIQVCQFVHEAFAMSNARPKAFLIDGDQKVKTTEGFTRLHEAASKGDLANVKLLLEKGAAINAQTQLGDTPLHLAAFYGHLEIAKLLLDKGAAIEAQRQLGDTPLHEAARQGHLAVVKLLLDKGASVDAQQTANNVTPLHLAAFYGHLEIAKLLLDKGAAVGVQGTLYSTTPLHEAATRGHLEVARLLLEYGAEVDVGNKAGVTPLDHAPSDEFRSAMIKAYQDKIMKDHTQRLRSAAAKLIACGRTNHIIVDQNETVDEAQFDAMKNAIAEAVHELLNAARAHPHVNQEVLQIKLAKLHGENNNPLDILTAVSGSLDKHYKDYLEQLDKPNQIEHYSDYLAAQSPQTEADAKAAAANTAVADAAQ